MFVFLIFEYDENFLFGEDYCFVDFQIGKYFVNKMFYYKIFKKDGKLMLIFIMVKERIRDGLFYIVGDGVFGYVSLLMFFVVCFGLDILIVDYLLDMVYVYCDDYLILLIVCWNYISENNILILVMVDVMIGCYLFWYMIVKDIDVKNNCVFDLVFYLYDRFINEYCWVDLVNRDVVFVINILVF